MIKSSLRFVLISSLAASIALGCGMQAAESKGQPTAIASSSASPTRVSAASLRIEQALRRIETGKELAEARTSLDEVVKDPAATTDERDEATLALSRALEGLGDHEGAVATTESLIAAHADDHPWRFDDRADSQLRKLLTGSEAALRGPDANEGPVAPIARVLTRYFPERAGQVTPVNLFFVGRAATSDRLGSFDIGGAMHALKREACALCDDRLNIHTKRSRRGSWTGIPAERSRYADALVVFYFDLGDGRIPARYDALLPMPSAEIVSRLEKGQGLIAVRERTGAPPIILLAAPREAQLADVDEAFAAMKSLPTEPTPVTISARLRPEEIKRIVRSTRAAHQKCAAALFAKTPDGGGSVRLHFKVRGDGSVSEEKLEAPTHASLADATFQSCVLDAVRPLEFPASGSDLTVSFPLVFTNP